MGETYKMSPNLVPLLLLLLLLSITQIYQPGYATFILLPEQQKALAQPITNQDGQQPEINQEAVVANLKNSSSLSLFDFPSDSVIIPSDVLENPDILIVDGHLITSSLFGMERTLSPPNRLNFTFEPLPDTEVRIIVADGSDNTIINITSVRTDPTGYFWTSVDAPSPRVLLIIAYFEGNENSFPTFDTEYLCEVCKSP